jgi:histidinol dehydrogenase
MVMRTIDLRGKKLTKGEYQKLLPRANFSVADAVTKINPILERVKSGDQAELIALCQEFDGVKPKSIRVADDELAKALQKIPKDVMHSLQVAIDQVRRFHQTQLPQEIATEVLPGGQIDRRWVALDRVGLYVPGGIATYPSSVIMNVVPAQIAGVKSIAIASPPQKNNDGLPSEIILATCKLLGVNEVYAIGGAQAIAMFGYGVTGVCEPVNLITGPGNIYVAAAKRALRGLVGIDSEAGPTEILILADKNANPNDVAADLISQAEHDELAAAVLVTDSQALIDQVLPLVDKRSAATKHSKRVRSSLAGQQSAVILVDSIDQGVMVVNAYAPEHLEIMVANSEIVAKQINNAGAIFLNRFSPVSLGDYAAGSNHVLPTGGCACHSSGLSVNTFMRNISVINYSQTAFNQVAQDVITLAHAEDLPAHAEAIEVRLEN